MHTSKHAHTPQYTTVIIKHNFKTIIVQKRNSLLQYQSFELLQFLRPPNLKKFLNCQNPQKPNWHHIYDKLHIIQNAENLSPSNTDMIHL
jgi:hypothetical protein